MFNKSLLKSRHMWFYYPPGGDSNLTNIISQSFFFKSNTHSLVLKNIYFLLRITTFYNLNSMNSLHYLNSSQYLTQ